MFRVCSHGCASGGTMRGVCCGRKVKRLIKRCGPLVAKTGMQSNKYALHYGLVVLLSQPQAERPLTFCRKEGGGFRMVISNI